MKRALSLVLIIALALVLAGCSSMKRSDMEETVYIAEDLEGSASDVFVKARSWMVDAFVSSDSVIEFEDKDAGVISGKYTTDVSQGLGTLRITSQITIECRDGRARLTITPGSLRISAAGSSWTSTNDLLPSSHEKYLEKTAALAESFASYMTSSASDW